MKERLSYGGLAWMVIVAVAALLVLMLANAQSVSAVSATMSVSPASQTVPAGNTVTVTIVQNATGGTVAAETDVTFNPAVLKLQDVVAGSAYSTASFFVGVAPQTKAQAIASANSTGSLLNAATYYSPGSTVVPAGNANFLVLTFTGCFNGTSSLTLTNFEMVDDVGNGVSPITPTNGSATISGTGTDTDGDGDADGCDTCPNWPNPSQALPNWTVPASDPDCDGFNTASESHVGTSPTTQCGFTSGGAPQSENWPPDLVESNSINISDVLALKPVFNTTVPPTAVRFDLVNSNSINISDVLALKPLFNKICSTSGP